MRRLVVTQWRTYLKIAVLFAVCAGVSLPLMPPMFRAFLGGVYITAYIALVHYSFAFHGLHYRMAGADAETWTSQSLGRLRGWWVIDRVEFENFDVDHVAVGTSRVLAVETKWTAKPLTVSATGVFGMGFDPVAQAKERAEKLARLLKSRGDTTPVVPVLVLWGPGVPKLEGGKVRVGPVRVLNGTQFDEWRGPFEKRLWHSRRLDRTRALLADYVHDAEEYRKKQKASPIER
jgi:hypothetical protein